MMMKCKTFTTVLLAMTLGICNLVGQHFCGTVATNDYPSDKEIAKMKKNHSNYKSNEMRVLPVQLHAIKNTEGISFSGFAQAIEDGMEELNRHFAPLNMHFLNCDDVNLVIGTNPAISYGEESTQIDTEQGKDGALNIYVAQTLEIAQGSYAGGWGTFPWWRDSLNYIFMDREYMNGEILAHEMGHHLGLFHTHETFSFSDTIIINPMTGDTIPPGVELVDQSNCETAGDRICDTPAEPVLRGNTSRCVYVGAEVDPLGVPYSNNPPDPTNFMSYAPDPCWNHFTPEQLERVNFWLAERMPELTCVNKGDIKLHDFVIEKYVTTEKENDFFIGEEFDITLDLSFFTFDKTEELPLDIKFYLSRNSIIDDSDVLLSEVIDMDIEENSYFTYNTTLQIPETYSDTGIRFLLISVDPDNEYDEQKEGNNFERYTVFINEQEVMTPTVDILNGKPLKVYPNPTQDLCHVEGIDSDYGSVVVELYNTYGMHVGSSIKTVQEGKFTIDTQSLFSGLYLANVFTLDGKQISTLKILRQE